MMNFEDTTDCWVRQTAAPPPGTKKTSPTDPSPPPQGSFRALRLAGDPAGGRAGIRGRYYKADFHFGGSVVGVGFWILVSLIGLRLVKDGHGDDA